jgi:glycosyltransferase involved in cell wall biosynthesis
MLKNRDILIFGEDWARFPSTTQHIGKVLLENNRVFWVGSLGHRKPRFVWSDVGRAFEKMGNMFFGRNQKKSETDQGKSPILINFPWIPYHDVLLIRKINNFFLKRKIKSVIKDYNLTDYVLITSTPLLGSVVKDLGPKSSHYLCLDDYSEFDGAFDALLIEEQALLEQVDTNFSISDILARTRKPINGKSVFITQGVEVDHFGKPNKSTPESLKHLSGPIVGFFGLVSEWVDIELIMYSASKLPDYTFVVVGRSTVDLSGFKQYKNIICTGIVPYSELPDYASIFDVGSIPFRVNELTLACNPLKMIEYFALGLPVVSTALPEVEKFGDAVLISRSNDEYVNLLKEAVESISPEMREKKLKLANGYSWTTITEKISIRIIESEVGR